MIIPVDRSQPFSPASGYGEGFSVSKHLSGTKTITEVPVDRLVFASPGCVVTSSITLLDSFVFQALWQHRDMLPKRFQCLPTTQYGFFQFYLDGTRFKNTFGVEWILYLRWGFDCYNGFKGEKCWSWGLSPEGYKWGYPFPSLVLVS